jgi:peptide/nickel transport system permease protein
VTVLVVQQTAALTRFMRSSMLDNLPLDYVRTARAKGLADRVVVLRHVLTNSLIPVVTLIALGIPTIFAGAIITENLFRVNGLGALLITSIQNSDTPVVMALTFIFAILTVTFNLVADVAYGLLDPRVRYS